MPSFRLPIFFFAFCLIRTCFKLMTFTLDAFLAHTVRTAMPYISLAWEITKRLLINDAARFPLGDTVHGVGTYLIPMLVVSPPPFCHAGSQPCHACRLQRAAAKPLGRLLSREPWALHTPTNSFPFARPI